MSSFEEAIILESWHTTVLTLSFHDMLGLGKQEYIVNIVDVILCNKKKCGKYDYKH